ncbi:Fic family protein [Patescibacteria group bacterium]|nr:Fic family protein [Patescibacteria group bacterium]
MFEPKFVISESMLNNLSRIAEAKSVVQRARLVPSRESFLRRWARVRMAYSSTSIEGNVLREDQVEVVSKGGQVRAEDEQILEVKNYLKALRLVDDMAGGDCFGKREILRLHKLVMAGLMGKEKIGRLRKVPVYVVNVLASGKEKLVYTAPESKLVSDLINNLISWLKNTSDLHPVIRAGLLHYQFETIHPFADGNGRTGRLLTLLHLYQSGWDFKRVLVLEDYYNKNRKEYFSKLQTGKNYKSRQKTDLTEWLEYYIEGFLMEVLRVEKEVLTLEFVGKKGLVEGYLKDDEMTVVDFTASLGRVTSGDVVDILKIPKRTAQSKLKLLVDKKVLQKKSYGPATYYVLMV